jgi:hypothetical protein
MPTSAFESWYCENVVSGPWPFLLLLLPLVGSYYYGQNKRKLAWILIGVWIPIQLALSFGNNVLAHCPGDEAIETPDSPGGATQPEPPAQPAPPAPAK